MGIAVPERCGGGGADTLSYVLALEEVAGRLRLPRRGHVGEQLARTATRCCKFGTAAQHERFLAPARLGPRPRLLRPHRAAGGLGRARTRPRWRARDGDDYVLNGRKVFVTNGRESTVALVFAQTDPRQGAPRHHAPSSSRRARRASPSPRPRTSSASAPPTPPSSCSRGAACPRRTGWAPRARGSRSRWRRSTAGASASPPRRSASPRGAYEAAVAYARERKSVRRAHRPAPDGPVDARRHGDGRRRGAPAHAGARPR